MTEWGHNRPAQANKVAGDMLPGVVSAGAVSSGVVNAAGCLVRVVRSGLSSPGMNCPFTALYI